MLQGSGIPQLQRENVGEHEFNISVSSIQEVNTRINTEEDLPKHVLETPVFPHGTNRQRLIAQRQVPITIMTHNLNDSLENEEVKKPNSTANDNMLILPN